MTNLQRLRLAAGLSQAQLADKAGISVRTVQGYECERRDINKAYLQIGCKLAEVLSVRPEDLLENDK